LATKSDQLTPTLVGALLTDQTLHQAATDVVTEIASLPSLAHLVPHLTRFALDSELSLPSARRRTQGAAAASYLLVLRRTTPTHTGRRQELRARYRLT
jgi:hypothetical protein